MGSALSVRWWPLHHTDGVDPSPSAHWPVPPLVFEPGPRDGPVLVSVTYRVAPADRAAFTDRMRHVARSRRRTGAVTWGSSRTAATPNGSSRTIWSPRGRSTWPSTGGSRRTTAVSRKRRGSCS
ncbi:MFS transporter [Streptomyces nogalater]